MHHPERQQPAVDDRRRSRTRRGRGASRGAIKTSTTPTAATSAAETNGVRQFANNGSTATPSPPPAMLTAPKSPIATGEPDIDRT